MRGKVKRFSDYKGYGFITGEDGEDYFVHYSMIEPAGYRTLRSGAKVEFTAHDSEQGWQAHDVRLVSDETAQPTASVTLKVNPFIPQDPAIDPKKFSGRRDSIINAVDCLFNNKNLLITGARGIGKSSIAYQLINLAQGDPTLLDRFQIGTGGFKFQHLGGDHRCVSGNSIQSVVRGLLQSVVAKKGERLRSTQSKTEFKLDLKLMSANYQESSTVLPFEDLSLEFVAATEELLRSAPEGTTGICYLLDEVDVLDPGTPIAPFLKAVLEKLRSDGFSNVSFILSGVTGSTTELIAQHPSAGRLTEPITLQPMSDGEIDLILTTALAETETTMAEDAKRLIIQLSGRFPAPTQLLGYHAYRLNTDDVITKNDVEVGRDFIVQSIKQQEFKGRVDGVRGGLGISILRVLASSSANGIKLEALAKSLSEELDRVAGAIGNLVRDGLVQRQGHLYGIAEPLFRIYLRWLFASK